MCLDTGGQGLLAAASKKSCCQCLLDLVKAYDKIRHWALQKEAVRQVYPVWLLRPAVGAYRLMKHIRLGGRCPR